MKVVHVTPALAYEASGPTYSVLNLVRSLHRRGCNVNLAALRWSGRESNAEAFVKLFRMNLGLRRLGRSTEMLNWLRRQAQLGEMNLIHGHGMWQMNAVYPGWIAKEFRLPYVASPRGTFSKWAMAHGSKMKTPFWHFVQRPSLLHVSCFHATAESEVAEIRRLGFKQPVAVIPNGIDVKPYHKRNDKSRKTLLYLGRLHPKKGLDILLDSWASICLNNPKWDLVIAGSDRGYHESSGYERKLMARVANNQIANVKFVGEKLGLEKENLYRNSDLFVLPTQSENFGITVAEALSFGTPVVVTKGAPWAEVVTKSCGWWVDINSKALTVALEEAMNRSPDSLIEMGVKGRDWMQQDFSWKRIAEMTEATYSWILSGEQKPSWVQLLK